MKIEIDKLNQEKIDSLIKQRLELYEKEVDPILKASPKELENISFTRQQFEDYVHAVGQKFMQLAVDREVPTLAPYDHYMGGVDGVQVIHKLLNLMRAKKIPALLTRDDIEFENIEALEYSCSACGHNEIFSDHKYCPYCGVELY